MEDATSPAFCAPEGIVDLYSAKNVAFDIYVELWLYIYI